MKRMVRTAADNTVNKSVNMLTSLILSAVMACLTALIFAGPMMLLWNTGVTEIFTFPQMGFFDAFEIVLFLILLQALFYFKFVNILKPSFSDS